MAWKCHTNLPWKVNLCPSGETDANTAITALADEQQQNSVLQFKTTTPAIPFALVLFSRKKTMMGVYLIPAPMKRYVTPIDSCFDVYIFFPV